MAKFKNNFELIHGDCMEYLYTFNDNEFNVAICDPPYNVGRNYNEYNDDVDDYKYNEWCLAWFSELRRVSETVVMTVGYKNLKFWINQDPKHIIIWHKPNQNSPSPLGGFNAYEPVLFWGKTQKRIGHDIFTTNISIQKEASFHNCPKHLSSWTKLLNMVANENSKIIDIFSGSGTTAISCIDLNMDFLGFEIDKIYYDKSCTRISNKLNQLSLF